RLVASERGEWNGVGDAPLAEAIRGELARVGAGARAEVRALTLPAGVTEVLFERLAPVHALTAVGINAASLALARIAHGLGWQVTLVDGAEPPPETAALAGSVRVVRAARLPRRNRLARARRSHARCRGEREPARLCTRRTGRGRRNARGDRGRRGRGDPRQLQRAQRRTLERHAGADPRMSGANVDIAVVVLAAGEARRFGRAKQLALLDGAP